MAEEEPLYKDDRIKIESAGQPGDHALYLDSRGYVLPEGILKDLALVEGHRQTARTFNPGMEFAIANSGIEGRVYRAIRQAYTEDERRRKEYVDNMMKSEKH